MRAAGLAHRDGSRTVPASGSRTASALSAIGRWAAIPAFFAILALVFVGRGALPGQALLPIDDLFLYPPWRAYAGDLGVQTPHNPLIADAILQNYSWKRFAADSYAAGQLPLWNPLILGGQPFLASAQNGSLYPLGVLFYLLPLAQAYAWFLALHLWLGAMFARWFARTLGATPLGGVVAGITFGFCGYLVVSFLWPMVVSTAIWLPALLATIELAIQRPNPSPGPSPARGGETSPPPGAGRGRGRGRYSALIPLGAAIVGMQFLAGHLEMSLYLLLTAGLYTAIRLTGEIWAGHLRRAFLAGAAALAMVALGAALAAIQLVPFAEVIRANVRGDWSDYAESVGYALPRERWIAFFVPDYFGNPSHHTYLDLVDGQIHSVEHVRANQELRHDTEWGGKNYVEGTVYLGVLPLLLAPIGLLAHPAKARLALGLLALVATLFAFGTPLYALLFYGIPGVNQLHTPFRWVYPLSVCIAVLAGLGASALSRPRGPERATGPADSSVDPGASAEARWGVRIGLFAAGLGIGLVAALLALLLFRDAAMAVVAHLLARSPDLRAGFGDVRVLFSYQHANLLGSALLLAASGLALVVGARRRSFLAGALALGLLVGDLFSFGIGFNGVADTAPLELTPRSIQAIQADPTLFRVVTFGEDDTLPSNTNMLFGLQDIRGYDTIILREYVEYLELIEPQRGIAYSKVAKLFDERSLASPLLDLLNVKYVLTSKTVRQPGYTLAYEGEGIRVYRNERALPRAFVVASAVAASDRAAALASVGNPAFDPRRQVVLEGWSGPTSPAPPNRAAEPAEVVAYEGNRVVVRAVAPEGGFLVLGDVFFDGWTVSVDGTTQPLLRANALVRAVELAPGAHEVVFEYRPLSLRVGALVSALATVGLLFLCGVAARMRFRAQNVPSTVAQRVFHNAAFPMATSLLNKVLDVGFALVMFRVLQAEGVGAYTFAGVLIGYFDILVNFGLGTLITREVARDHTAAARYLGNSLVVRLVLWLVSGAAVGFLTGPGAEPLGITPPIALTIWLLWWALLPGILSGGLSALFMAYERMTTPAVVTVMTTLMKVGLGLVALAAGWGYVGLAAVALVTNTITALILLGLYAATVGLPGVAMDWRFSRSMATVSLPLMVNNLLNSVFFRIDALLLKPLAGDVALGWYSTAYKFIDGLQIIPSSFVLAIFPLLSRHATEDRERLAQLTRLSLKTLLTVALPISVGTTILAEPIIQVFAGASYLPETAHALQVLIWFLPLSFVNGLLQYVLIAVDRQRWITLSFLIGAAFNLLANLALIPAYGYLAASAVTVASELVLLAPFWRVIRRELPPIDLLGLAWRPALAALAMAVPVWLASGWSVILAIPAGAVAYGAALLLLGGLDVADRATLRGLLRL